MATQHAWLRVLKQHQLDRGKLNRESQKIIYRFIENSWPKFEAPTNVAAWRAESTRLRKAAVDRVYLKGFPRNVVDGKPSVVWTDVLRPDPSFVIRKLRYEIFPDYWIPALLYEPTGLRGKAPVMLNPNGHHGGGKAVSYKQIRCANLARRGVIALNIEFIGMCELEADRYHNDIAHLNLTGLSGVGMFYLALKRGLDVLLAHKNADAKRVGVTGLSGGGWQTIVISSLDPRVTLSVPAAGYTSVRARVRCVDDIGDSEQVPVDLCSVLDYQEMTAMLAPKPLLHILNSKDECCFRTDRAKPIIYDAVKPTYEAFGAAENIQVHNNLDPGIHNYGEDNRAALYRFLNEHWDLDSSNTDIHADSDIFTEQETNVGLPENHRTLMELALQRARKLTRAMKIPRTAAERAKLRRRLADVIRLPEYRVPASKGSRGGTRTELLAIGPWKVPISLKFDARKSGTHLIISDQGREKSELGRGRGADAGLVGVADILGTGENATDFQRLMLIETAGHRVLGVQVAQILACAEWLCRMSNHSGGRRITLIGEGWTSSIVCLVAAATQPRLFAEVRNQGGMMGSSLMRLIDRVEHYEGFVPLFCFGLLEVADLPQIKALLEDVRYAWPDRHSPQ